MAWTNLNSEDVGIKVKGTPAVSSTESLRTRPGRVQTGGTSPMGTPSKLPLPPCPGVLTASICLPYGTDRCSTALVKAAPGVGWRDWENVGGQRMTLTSAPVAAATGPNRVDCFGRGSNDGHLIHAWYQDGLKQDWTEPDNLTIRDAPAIVSGATADRGRVDVFIRGTDDIMRHRVYYTALQPGQPSAGSWEPGSNWNHTSTNKIFSAPAAVAWWSGNALKRIDCFAQDANNNLLHTRWM